MDDLHQQTTWNNGPIYKVLGVTGAYPMIRIGRGRREFIIGDRPTVLTDVVCVYVALGQKTSTVAEMGLWTPCLS